MHDIDCYPTAVERVPAGVRRPGATELALPPAQPDAPPTVSPRLPVRWISTEAALAEVCSLLRTEKLDALDVETTLGSRALCLVQLASPEVIYLVDALEISNLEALGDLLADERVEKVIHNAPFERSVFARFGFRVEPVTDTLEVSRRRRGKIEGGPGLKAVCSRELGVQLDKSEQVSDWSRRPLSERQLAYAAVDAEVLLQVRAKLLQA